MRHSITWLPVAKEFMERAALERGEFMKEILQGNEAIARGAWEAGTTIGCAYPGTPSSEITAELSKYPEVCALRPKQRRDRRRMRRGVFGSRSHRGGWANAG
jgi:hypothetical protein